jgi:hypothetical protein
MSDILLSFVIKVLVNAFVAKSLLIVHLFAEYGGIIAQISGGISILEI